MVDKDNDVIIMEETSVVPREENRLEVKREVLDWGTLIKMSEMLAKSTIIPIQYQNRAENVMVALDLASRMGVSPMVVMQNLYVIQGKPSFSGQAIASMVRTNPNLRNVTINYVGEENTDSWGAYITAERVSDGRILKGTTVTIAMAKAEGWYQKSGSKWKTIPELMLAYRSYTYFGRVYLPEVFMGLHQLEEIEDIQEKQEVKNPYSK